MKSINEVKQFIVELLKLFPDNKTDYAHIGKAYFYANRFALEDYSTLVSIHRCVKLDYGPAIDSYMEIFNDLQEEGVIVKEKPHHIKLMDDHAKYTDFPKEVINSIQKAYLHVEDKGFGQLTAETHGSKSYKKARMHEEIDYANDIFTDEEIRNVKKFSSNTPRFV